MVVNIDTGHLYITNEPFASITGDTLDDTSYTVVKIERLKIDDNFNNTVPQFNISVSPSSSDTSPPETNLIGLKNIKNVISVQGYLATDSTDSAYEKKQKLLFLAGNGGCVEHSLA